MEEDARFCPDCGTPADEGTESRKTSDGGVTSTADSTVTSPKTISSQAVGETNVLGRRTAAVIVDTIVLGVFASLISAGLGIRGPWGLVFVSLPLFFLYFWLLEGFYGKTIGKKLLGLTIVTTDGAQIGPMESLIRNLLRFVDGVFYYFVGFIVIAMSKNNQRIGDHAANTFVVRE